MDDCSGHHIGPAKFKIPFARVRYDWSEALGDIQKFEEHFAAFGSMLMRPNVGHVRPVMDLVRVCLADMRSCLIPLQRIAGGNKLQKTPFPLIYRCVLCHWQGKSCTSMRKACDTIGKIFEWEQCYHAWAGDLQSAYLCHYLLYLLMYV